MNVQKESYMKTLFIVIILNILYYHISLAQLKLKNGTIKSALPTDNRETGINTECQENCRIEYVCDSYIYET